MKWIKYGLWISSLLVASAISSGARAEDVPYEKDLYMWDGGDGRTLIVASPLHLEQALFQSSSDSPGETLISTEQLEAFVQALNRAGSGQRTYCSVSPAKDLYSHTAPGMPAVPDSRPKVTAIDMIRGQPSAVIGVVEGKMVSAGFDGSVTTLVFVRVDEILNDSSHTMAVGDLVTFEQPWGELEIRQATLCTRAPEGVLQVEPGDTVIVSGSMFYWNEKHIETTDSGYFRVDDGVIVHAPRRKDFKGGPPMDLATLRRELERLDSE